MVSFPKNGLIFLLCLFVFSSPGLAVNQDVSSRIDKEITRHQREIIQIRRFLHMNPELSRREYETSKLLASKLLSLGLEVERQVAQTGVVALLRGNDNGLTIGVRAPMDALPIQEATNLPYKSLNPGIMHASGNDIHMSIVLGTAMVLTSLQEEIKGSIKFIFQPAGEGENHEKMGGARLMIREGVLKTPPVGAIFGFRVWPAKLGTVLFSSGPVLASSDRFSVVVKGKPSHGARPHEGIDAISLASQIIITLQNILNRTIDPTQPSVVSVGKIQGGIRSDLTAPQVRFEGTVRTFSHKSREKLPELIEKVVQGVTLPAGADYTFRYQKGPPPVYNHPELAQITLPTLYDEIGEDHVKELTPLLLSEDFSHFCEKIPGFYFLLGAQPPGQNSMAPLYSPRFNPEEDSILLGIRILCRLLLDTLESQSDLEPSAPDS